MYRFVATLFVILSIFFLSGAVSADGEKRLTLDEALGFAGDIDQYGAIPRLRWLRSLAPGEAPALVETRFEVGGASLYRVDARSGATVPLYDHTALENALAALPGVDRENAKAAARNASALRLDDTDKRALLEIKGDLFAYDFISRRAARVTAIPTQRRNDVTFSPDGSHVAYIAGNDLYIAAVSWANGTVTPPRRITTDGSARVFNGHLDWVYEEEVYGRGNTQGYRWSADGSHLAFLRLDDSAITPVPIMDHSPRIPFIEEELYPKAGDSNPKATLGIVSVREENSSVVWADLSAYPEADRLIVRFGFAPGAARLLVQVQKRNQTFLHLLLTNTRTGDTTKIIEETSPAWVDVLDEPIFLSDSSFLWRSARTGYRHLYHYDLQGNLLGTVTKGDWDVMEVLTVDEVGGSIYFNSNKSSAAQIQMYAVRIDGVDGETPKRLTKRNGSHAVEFDPTKTLFLDRWNDLNNPTQLRLHSTKDGAEVRPLGANLLPVTTRRGYRLSVPKLLTIKARDGVPLDALILKPADFSPTKKYPIVYCLYGGPELPTVLDQWGVVSLWHQYLAQQGCLVFMCDNRSASGKGVKNVWSVYKHLGESETRDIEDAVEYLKTLPYADTTRIGVFGWSYGGFLVEYLLTHSNSFTVGVAGGGVSDWRLYDSIYAERFMDTPQANFAGYLSSAPLTAVNKLNGKLLLLHGTLDDNVHLQNTMQMIYALQRAGKTFDMMLYPRSRHTITDPALSRHMRTLLTSYLLDNLHAIP